MSGNFPRRTCTLLSYEICREKKERTEFVMFIVLLKAAAVTTAIKHNNVFFNQNIIIISLFYAKAHAPISFYSVVLNYASEI